MADEEVEDIDVLERLKAELIADYCAYKLWKEFKTGSQLSREFKEILKDLYSSKQTSEFDDELGNKLHCTRFICGLSEAMITRPDGSLQYNALNSLCLTHAEHILKMYPFSSAEQAHLKSIIKLQVILSHYRAAKVNRAKKLFLQLYPETSESEKYQDELQELLQSENDNLKEKLLHRFSYEKFLQNVCTLLNPFWEKYNIPLLEMYKDDLSQVEEGRIPGFFLKAYHDNSLPVDEDCEESWKSIINETHPDIRAFKKRQRNLFQGKEKETTNKRTSGEHGKSPSDNGSTSSSVDVQIKKSEKAVVKLKTSSNQLHEFIKQRGKQDTNEEEDSYDSNEDICLSERKPNHRKNTSVNNDTKIKSPFKRRWNEHQRDAETIEWEESDEENYQAIYLPSPKRRLDVLLPSPIRRRKKNPWTDEEVSWLLEGVQKHGEGNWATILRTYPFRFRTSVDLKDKWRNYCKSDK